MKSNLILQIIFLNSVISIVGCGGSFEGSDFDQSSLDIIRATPTPEASPTVAPTSSPSPTVSASPTSMPSVTLTPSPTQIPAPTTTPTVVPTPGLNSNNDFLARCNAAGVVKCNGFDAQADLNRSDIYIETKSVDARSKTSIDLLNRASGGGSLRFDIPENTSYARLAPPIEFYFGQDFGPRNLPRFANKNKLYVQFKQRFTKEWTKGYQLGDQHFKQVTINGGGSCGDETIVTENSSGRGFPQLYSDCGYEHYSVKEETNDSRNGYTLYQHGGYYCSRYDINKNDYSRCAMYKADQWITFYYEIEFGDEDQKNSVVRAYIGYEGEPLKLFMDFRQLEVNADRDSGPQQYNTLSILPYITRKSEPNEAAVTWYDEVIISSQPIAAPLSNR